MICGVKTKNEPTRAPMPARRVIAARRRTLAMLSCCTVSMPSQWAGGDYAPAWRQLRTSCCHSDGVYTDCSATAPRQAADWFQPLPRLVAAPDCSRLGGCRTPVRGRGRAAACRVLRDPELKSMQLDFKTKWTDIRISQHFLRLYGINKFSISAYKPWL